ncbi:TPA: hypothetical protein ACHVIL_000838 [Streptococcus suis]
MLKKYAWPLASLILTGAIWFLTPASDPTWIKNSIFAGFLIYLLLLFLFISKLPKPDPDEPFYFGLSEKIYTVTLLAAMGIYGKGIWVITPATNPSWIKDVFLGFGLFLLMAFFLYFAFKKVDEKPDDRFYTNLAKAARLPKPVPCPSQPNDSYYHYLLPALHSHGWYDSDFQRHYDSRL